MIPSKSSTASRLSQRLLVSVSALLGFILESWDVGAAFLKGFNFRQLEDALKKKGIVIPRRECCLVPPKNVWRHFRSIPGCKWVVREGAEHLWLLLLIKAMYGLIDAPLAWQLCLTEFFLEVLDVRKLLKER